MAIRRTIHGLATLVLGVAGGYFAAKAWIESP